MRLKRRLLIGVLLNSSPFTSYAQAGLSFSSHVLAVVPAFLIGVTAGLFAIAFTCVTLGCCSRVFVGAKLGVASAFSEEWSRGSGARANHTPLPLSPSCSLCT